MTEPSTTRLAPTVLARVAEFAVEHHCEQVTVADLADQGVLPASLLAGLHRDQGHQPQRLPDSASDRVGT